MARGKKTIATVNLDGLPEGKLLRVRNVTARVLALSSRNAEPDVVLNPQAEQVLPAVWSRNASLRKAVNGGWLQAEAVEAGYEPRRVPSVDEAPEEARPITGYDRVYAQNIVLIVDPGEALQWVNVNVRETDSQIPDTRFMKTRFLPILQYVRWAEPQLQNRSQVLSMVRKRIDEIRTM